MTDKTIQQRLTAVGRSAARVQIATAKVEREAQIRRRAVLDALRAGVPVQTVADAARVSRQTVHAWSLEPDA